MTTAQPNRSHRTQATIKPASQSTRCAAPAAIRQENSFHSEKKSEIVEAKSISTGLKQVGR
jgi:hypothetical protein